MCALIEREMRLSFPTVSTTIPFLGARPILVATLRQIRCFLVYSLVTGSTLPLADEAERR